MNAAGHGKNLLERLPPPRKVAVVRAPRLGDYVCATPALRALRAAMPDAEIVLITLPALRELVLRLPYVDRFAPFPGFPGVAQQLFEPRTALAFLRRMQQERFDLAIQLHGSGVYANPFTLLLGARATVGFVRPEDDASLLDAALPWPPSGRESLRLLALLRHIGVTPRGEEFVYPLTAVDRRSAEILLHGLPRPLIGIHAGSHDPRRRWPLPYFVQVARALLHRGGSAVVIGSASEAVEAGALARSIGPRAHSFAGRTGLATLGAVIEQLDLLITNDSGPAHIGYALGAPTVVIYRRGGTDRYGPPVQGPFAALEPDTPQDDTLVSMEQVLAAAERLLGARTDRVSELAACPPSALRRSAE
ncbi:MAG TPA: glycosyltransferase family 9 protein [Burkholderiales bacterium]